MNLDQIARLAALVIERKSEQYPFPVLDRIDPDGSYRLSIHAVFGLCIRDFAHKTGLTNRYCFMLQEGKRGMSKVMAEHVSHCTGVEAGLILTLTQLSRHENARRQGTEVGPSRIPDFYAHYFYEAPKELKHPIPWDAIRKAAETNRGRKKDTSASRGEKRVESIANYVRHRHIKPDKEVKTPIELRIKYAEAAKKRWEKHRAAKLEAQKRAAERQDTDQA